MKIDEASDKLTFIGEVQSRDRGEEMYYDVSPGGLADFLTDELSEFEGKKVKVTVEVVE